MRNWIIYTALIITYIIMQISSVFVTIPLINYFSNNFSFTEQEANFHGVAFSLFITNLAAAIVFFLFIFRGKNFFKVFDGKPSSFSATILWGILAFFLALFGQMLAGVLNMFLFGVEPGSDNTAILSDIAKISPIIIISMVIFAPLLEEIIFRRVLFGGLYHKTNFWIATIVSALVFAVVHMELENTLVYMAPAFAFSFVYYKSKRLLAPMIGHFLMNGFVVVVQLNYDKILELQDLQQSFIAFFQ